MLQSDTTADVAAVTSILHGWLQDWRNVANAELADGRLTHEGHRHFIERAESGVCDGLEAASAPRTLVPIPDAPLHLFRSRGRAVTAP